MSIKLNSRKEKVLVPKFMSDEYEEMDGQYFEYEGIRFYLIKGESGGWCITEDTTKKFMVTWRKTRKQALSEFEDFMEQHLDRVKAHICRAIEEDA